jgi:hypothetical protein
MTPLWEGIGAQLPPFKKPSRKERAALRALGLLPPTTHELRAIAPTTPVALRPPLGRPVATRRT